MVSQPDAVIECLGLTKIFKDFWMRPRVTAVDALDLRVLPREVFGLLGPNGSGKSTTIKMLLGLLFPTKGRIAVLGQHPTDRKVKERIGYLPEESYLYRFLNARETLEYYGRLFNLDRSTRIKRIDMLLDMVGLSKVQRRPVGEYSKGMQRRIGLAQALINDPDLLILDEPTTGLDPIGTRQIKDLILKLRERGKTVLLCSHLLGDVEDVCDRVTVLYGGKKRAEGSVDDLLTVGDATILQTDRLSAEAIEKIRAIVEQDHGTIQKVYAPRKKLEALFLEIVQRAQQEGVDTAGAQTQHRIAEFLADGAAVEKPAEGQALIEELVEKGQLPTQVPAPDQPPSNPTGQPASEPRQEVIDALTAPQAVKAETNASQKIPAEASQKPSDSRLAIDDVDRDIIDGLLKGKDE